MAPKSGMFCYWHEYRPGPIVSGPQFQCNHRDMLLARVWQSVQEMDSPLSPTLKNKTELVENYMNGCLKLLTVYILLSKSTPSKAKHFSRTSTLYSVKPFAYNNFPNSSAGFFVY